jgi:hypothetical protein
MSEKALRGIKMMYRGKNTNHVYRKRDDSAASRLLMPPACAVMPMSLIRQAVCNLCCTCAVTLRSG